MKQTAEDRISELTKTAEDIRHAKDRFPDLIADGDLTSPSVTPDIADAAGTVTVSFSHLGDMGSYEALRFGVRVGSSVVWETGSMKGHNFSLPRLSDVLSRLMSPANRAMVIAARSDETWEKWQSRNPIEDAVREDMAGGMTEERRTMLVAQLRQGAAFMTKGADMLEGIDNDT